MVLMKLGAVFGLGRRGSGGYPLRRLKDDLAALPVRLNILGGWV